MRPRQEIVVRRLVLDGVPPGDGGRVVDAFAAELTRLLTEHPIGGRTAPPPLRPRVGPATPAEVGVEAAHTVHARLVGEVGR